MLPIRLRCSPFFASEKMLFIFFGCAVGVVTILGNLRSLDATLTKDRGGGVAAAVVQTGRMPDKTNREDS